MLWEDFAPRNERERYRIYEVLAGGVRHLLATTGTKEGIGTCLVTFFEEGEITPGTNVGVLDGIERKWIVNPYMRRQP